MLPFFLRSCFMLAIALVMASASCRCSGRKYPALTSFAIISLGKGTTSLISYVRAFFDRHWGRATTVPRATAGRALSEDPNLRRVVEEFKGHAADLKAVLGRGGQDAVIRPISCQSFEKFRPEAIRAAMRLLLSSMHARCQRLAAVGGHTFRSDRSSSGCLLQAEQSDFVIAGPDLLQGLPAIPAPLLGRTPSSL